MSYRGAGAGRCVRTGRGRIATCMSILALKARKVGSVA
jgi:hypothetical protein